MGGQSRGKVSKRLGQSECPRCGEMGTLKTIKHYSKRTGKLYDEFEVCAHPSFSVDGRRIWGKQCYLGLITEPSAREPNREIKVNYL
jgi:hypothetical protein